MSLSPSVSIWKHFCSRPRSLPLSSIPVKLLPTSSGYWSDFIIRTTVKIHDWLTDWQWWYPDCGVIHSMYYQSRLPFIFPVTDSVWLNTAAIIVRSVQSLHWVTSWLSRQLLRLQCCWCNWCLLDMWVPQLLKLLCPLYLTGTTVVLHNTTPQMLHYYTTLHQDFSALTLLVGHLQEHTACNKIEWWAVGVVICLERGADCLHMVQLMPLHPKTPSSLASFKSRLVLPFW